MCIIGTPFDEAQRKAQVDAAREAAWGRLGGELYGPPLQPLHPPMRDLQREAMAAQRTRNAQTTHAGLASGRHYTRDDVLTSLRAIQASKGGIAEAITAFENL